MPDLTEALTAACEFAREHGVPGDFTPADFGLQRSAPGYTHATHVTPTHLIAVTVSEDEGVCVGVGRIEWVHFPLDAGCGECAPAAPAAAPYGDLFPSTRLGEPHAERYARTVAELHALPARAVVGDRMGWLAVLTDELLDVPVARTCAAWRVSACCGSTIFRSKSCTCPANPPRFFTRSPPWMSTMRHCCDSSSRTSDGRTWFSRVSVAPPGTRKCPRRGRDLSSW